MSSEWKQSMPTNLTELAHRQWRDYRARQPGTCFLDPGFVLDLPEAYALQSAVSALRVAAGERIVGYKVGCTGPGTVAQFGMRGPIRAYLYDSELRRTGDGLNGADFANLAVEAEMALLLGDDTRIAAAFPVIELHHFVFRAKQKTLVELVANNGLNAGVVLPDQTWMSCTALLEQPATLSLRINGAVIDSGDLWPLPGGPAASLDWLKGHLAGFGLTLEPGHIILAGTPLGLYPVRSGDDIAVLVDDRPAARCSVCGQ